MFVGDSILMVRVPIYNVSKADMKALHDAANFQTGEWDYFSFKDFNVLEDIVQRKDDSFSREFIEIVKAVLENDYIPLGEIEFLISEDEDDDSL